MNYDKLFEPFSLTSRIQLPNLLVMAPMTTTAGNDDGSFSDQEITYLARRAKAGIGTIISPACYCHKSGHSFPGQVGCHTDQMIPSLARCAEAIKTEGGKAVLQIHHGGNAAKAKLSGQAPIAPSAVQNRRGTSGMPTEMTVEQIHEISESFALASARAKKAGFDAIELHGANTYLFQQFFSLYTNRRDDNYGAQTIDNRCRFATETVKAVRDAVGPDYPIFYRVSPEEEEPDGYTTEDVIELLKRIVPLGIDCIHVSSWEYGKGLYPEPKPGQHATKGIKQGLSIPTIGVGKINTPDQAMRVLDDGVDLIAMGRVLLCDPDWAIKVKSGRAGEIRQTLEKPEDIDKLEVPDKMKAYLKKF